MPLKLPQTCSESVCFLSSLKCSNQEISALEIQTFFPFLWREGKSYNGELFLLCTILIWLSCILLIIQIIFLYPWVFGFISMHVHFGKKIKWVIEVHFEKLKHNYGPNSLLTLVMHLNLMFGSKDSVCLFDYVLTRKTCLFYLNSIVLRILWKKRWKCKFIIGKRTDTVCSFVHLFIHSFIQCLRTDHVPGIVLGLGISNAQSPCPFRFYIVERRRTAYEEINI